MSQSEQDNEKRPIAEISSGSVSIPIYESPVTIKSRLQHSRNAAANSKSDDERSEDKTYPSFKIVYYEGKRRVFRRRNTLEKAKAFAREVAGQLARNGVRARCLTEQDRCIDTLAQEAVKPLGLEVDQACRHYAELRSRVKGATLEEVLAFHHTFGQRVRRRSHDGGGITTNTSGIWKDGAREITTGATSRKS